MVAGSPRANSAIQQLTHRQPRSKLGAGFPRDGKTEVTAWNGWLSILASVKLMLRKHHGSVKPRRKKQPPNWTTVSALCGKKARPPASIPLRQVKQPRHHTIKKPEAGCPASGFESAGFVYRLFGSALVPA
jgi:hypothetical protein